MKTPTQRGPYGRWLLAARMDRGLATAEDARAALQAAGISIAKSTYAEYESGAKVPSRNHLPELERFFGPFTDPASDRTPEAGSLAAALSELATELRLAREERTVLAAKVAELEAVVDGLVERATAVAIAPGARTRSAGAGQ